MKTRSFQIRFLFGLIFWLGVALVGLASIGGAQTRAIKPVRIEAKTAQNETVSYIYSESHALVIGVSQYRNGWSNLPGVQEDVEEVSQSLEANGFQVTTIKDPGLDELETAIEDFIFEKGARNENRLLIYYAGHGHTMTLGYGGEMGFLVPADAPVPEKENQIRFQRKVLSMQRIEEVAKSTSAKHVLFMFDACFAGSVFLATRAAPAYIQQNTKEPVRQFITSGSAEQEVPDKSIFRRAFVDALNGKADYDKDGYLTGTELGAYIQKRTAEDWEGKLTPQYGKLQDPNLNKGDFVFEISKPGAVEPPPAEPVRVAPPPDLAAQAWSMIENSENPKAFELFLQEFPESAQASLAKLKLMLLLPPTAATKLEDSISESQNELAESSPVTPLPEPITPPLEQSVVINKETGSNSRYRWTAEVVEDKEKKLIWQRTDSGERTFSGAQIHCNRLSLNDANNWRLLTFVELSGLLKREFAREVLSQLTKGFFWATNTSGIEIFDPWQGKGRAALPNENYLTVCVSEAGRLASAKTEMVDVKALKTLPQLTQGSQNLDQSNLNESGLIERYRWSRDFVEDMQANLIWQRGDGGIKNFEQAEEYCAALSLSGVENWRLPDLIELRNLIAELDVNPSLTEIFQQRFNNFFWSQSFKGKDHINVKSINLYNGLEIESNSLKESEFTTVCVKNIDTTERVGSSEQNHDFYFYDNLQKSSREVAGCGFFLFGCSDKSLDFPPFRTDYHVKDYRRINLWGKDKPWTYTELLIEPGDKVYFYGTGEVTTCSSSNCDKRGPQNLLGSSISYFMGTDPFSTEIENLGPFYTFQRQSLTNKKAYWTVLSPKYGGILNLSVRDGDPRNVPKSNYDDNSGVYIFDIFVIDPEQEEGFNLFKDALFEANPEDSNAIAYLGN